MLNDFVGEATRKIRYGWVVLKQSSLVFQIRACSWIQTLWFGLMFWLWLIVLALVRAILLKIGLVTWKLRRWRKRPSVNIIWLWKFLGFGCQAPFVGIFVHACAHEACNWSRKAYWWECLWSKCIHKHCWLRPSFDTAIEVLNKCYVFSHVGVNRF